jgi:hypothetical protein
MFFGRSLMQHVQVEVGFVVSTDDLRAVGINAYDMNIESCQFSENKQEVFRF